jgi:hypothetical protein
MYVCAKTSLLHSDTSAESRNEEGPGRRKGLREAEPLFAETVSSELASCFINDKVID